MCKPGYSNTSAAKPPSRLQNLFWLENIGRGLCREIQIMRYILATVLFFLLFIAALITVVFYPLSSTAVSVEQTKISSYLEAK